MMDIKLISQADEHIEALGTAIEFAEANQHVARACLLCAHEVIERVEIVQFLIEGDHYLESIFNERLKEIYARAQALLERYED